MTSVCIIGDNFMLADVFAQKLVDVIPEETLTIEKHTFNWPGEPLIHGHTEAGMDGLKEYFGEADDVIAKVGDASILITHLAPISKAMLEHLPRLKLIAVSRGGPVNINLDACRERGVTVVNTPARNASAVAEFTIGAILTESRNIRAGHEGIRNNVWSDKYYRADTAGRELCEMTVGIVGYGAIGRKVARLLSVFGCKIYVYDPYATLSAEDAAAGVQMLSLEDLLQGSDVVTLHPKVTPETIGMINTQSLSLMKNEALLVNTTRGSLCDDTALVHALATGKLSGAVIDTFTTEPLPAAHPLQSLPNVTLTPHIAGASVRTVAYAAEQTAEEVRRYLLDEPPINPQ